MDEDLKSEFDSLCNSFGMSMTTAINVFARAVVHERRIPFEISAEPITSAAAIDNYLRMRETGVSRFDKEPAIDEINAEIDAAKN